MDPDFWHGRWQEKQIGFHQAEPNKLLKIHWPALGLAPASRVFIPLAGKSVDMVWLAGRGHRIIANELSRIAVEEFFDEQELTPETRDDGEFTVFTAGPYEIWCGDIFALPDHVTAGIAAIYDRASLIALPTGMRRRYATKLGGLIHDAARSPSPVRNLLITLEYDQSLIDGPPHAVLPDEIDKLFAKDWTIEKIAHEDGAAVSPKFAAAGIDNVGQTVYLLTSLPGSTA